MRIREGTTKTTAQSIRSFVFLATCICIAVTGCPHAYGQTIIHVDGSVAGGTEDGTSWANAYPFLSDALDAAQTAFETGGSPIEVWVTVGTYFPDENVLNPNGTGDTGTNFAVPRETSLYGGFSETESSISQRARLVQPIAYPPAGWTILSGDLDEDDDLSIPPFDSLFGGYGNRADNSKRVVNLAPLAEISDAPVVFDSFFVSSGHDESDNSNGAGMRCSAFHVTISDSVFNANSITGTVGTTDDFAEGDL